MAQGGEDWEIKSEVISDADEARMLDYLQKTGKYSIHSLPTSSTPYSRHIPSYTHTPSFPPYVPTPGSFPFPPPTFPPAPWTTLQQPPRISAFSGEEPVPKGETTFENWKFEVRCLMKDDSITSSALMQSVRKSLRGGAARVLISLGEFATASDILQRLEGPYGTIITAEQLLQQFHQATQKESETVASWGIRLEDILQSVFERGSYLDAQASQAMLRNRFWTGLRNAALKDATRHAFYSAMDFHTLLQTVRLIEQEINSSQPVKPRPSRSQHQSHTLGSTQPLGGPSSSPQDQTARQLSDITKRLEKLEVDSRKPSTDSHLLQQILDRLKTLESKETQPQQYSLPPQRTRGRGRRGQGRGRGSSNKKEEEKTLN